MLVDPEREVVDPVCVPVDVVEAVEVAVALGLAPMENVPVEA